MGDMGDLFNDLKDIRRTRAQQRVAEFQGKRSAVEDAIKEVIEEKRAKVTFNVDGSGTFNVRVFSYRELARSRGKGSTIQFYPTKGTWQVKGRMWHGGIDAFETWIVRALRKTL